MTTPPNSGKCPVTYGLDIFGDRWSLLIVRDILFKQKQHYGEFAKSAEKISSNILAARLTKLETEGILSKAPDPTNAKRFVYSLTDKGARLIPVILEIIAWSARFDPQPDDGWNIIDGAPPDLLHRMTTDRAALIAELTQAVLHPSKSISVPRAE